MLKTRKRWISLLVTLAMLVTFAVPFVGPAAASTGIRALSVPDVSDGEWQNVGDVVIEVDGGALAKDHSVTLSLPDKFKFVDNVDKAHVVADDVYSVGIYDENRSNYEAVQVVIPSSYAGNNNELARDDVFVELLDENEIKITLLNNPTYSGADEAIIKLVINKIWIKDGASGDVQLTAETSSDSAFPSGDVTIARVPGGKCVLSVPEVNTFTDTKIVKFRVKETTTGSLCRDEESLKLTLPDGFEWAKLDNSDLSELGNNYYEISGGYVAYKKIWGDDVTFNSVDVNDNKDELIFDVDGESAEQAAYYEFAAKVTVSDETKADEGDVTVSVGGESDCNVDSFVIATYGDYGAKIEADDPGTAITAGMLDQDASDIKIKENAAGSFVTGRTIILTLPDNAKWTQVDEDGDSDNGCDLDFVGPVGDDGRSIKYKVVDESTDEAAELKLSDFQVAVEPGYTGDLVVTVSGSAGLSGDVVIGKVTAPVTAAASAIPDIKIGMGAQPAGDLTITETAAGAIKDDAYMIVDLPSGVSFSEVPTVEVTSGNLDIDQSTVKTASDGDTSDNQLKFKISNDSTTASTIKISNIKLTADRTVPEGNVKVTIKGAAVAETADADAIDEYFDTTWGEDNLPSDELPVIFNNQTAYTLNDEDLFFPNSTSAASAVIAKIVTPAPIETKGVAIFKIGEAKYTVNGQEYTMDVAPVAEAGRTYLPARFVANAMGVPDSNIIWDQANQTVTVIRNERIVQMKVGSNQILVNGVPLTMDVAPKVVPGRVLIPFRFLAQALGAEVVWDAADPNTITLNF